MEKLMKKHAADFNISSSTWIVFLYLAVSKCKWVGLIAFNYVFLFKQLFLKLLLLFKCPPN